MIYGYPNPTSKTYLNLIYYVIPETEFWMNAQNSDYHYFAWEIAQTCLTLHESIRRENGTDSNQHRSID